LQHRAPSSLPPRPCLPQHPAQPVRSAAVGSGHGVPRAHPTFGTRTPAPKRIRIPPRDGLLDGEGLILPPLPLPGRDDLPAESQAPVEVAPAVLLAVLDGLGEFEGVEIDGGDVGADDGRGLFGDAG